jgi:pantetheine-phosphate adenylyltransferase
LAAPPSVAIYPGSFDPITNGHLDLISRASRMVDLLVVAVLRNQSKHPLFSVDERREMIHEATGGFSNVEVTSFEGLLVDFAASRGASMILRGIRAVSDYELEWQMALMNRRLRPEIETVFLTAGEEFSFISSNLVKEVASLGGSVTGIVPLSVEARLQRKFAARAV